MQAVADPSMEELLAEHETWLRVERGLAPNTLAAYSRDLRRYTEYVRSRPVPPAAPGGHDNPALDERTINDYVDSLCRAVEDDGRARYSPATVARAVAAVRSFHRFCVEEGARPTDPSAAVSAPRVPQGLPKALTEGEVTQLLAAVHGDDPAAQRDRAMLEVLYAGGVRISELVGLDVGDVDERDGTARVLGKGSKERTVPLGGPARQALGDYVQGGRPALVRQVGPVEPALFLNRRGRRLTRQGAWSIVRTAGRRAGLGERLHPHVLRHSCATHMLDHGADIRVVQELLGHASLSTTQIYTKVSPERLRAVYETAHPRARRASPGG
jgi:integrase/recombinase XerD